MTKHCIRAAPSLQFTPFKIAIAYSLCGGVAAGASHPPRHRGRSAATGSVHARHVVGIGVEDGISDHARNDRALHLWCTYTATRAVTLRPMGED